MLALAISSAEKSIIRKHVIRCIVIWSYKLVISVVQSSCGDRSQTYLIFYLVSSVSFFPGPADLNFISFLMSSKNFFIVSDLTICKNIEMKNELFLIIYNCQAHLHHPKRCVYNRNRTVSETGRMVLKRSWRKHWLLVTSSGGEWNYNEVDRWGFILNENERNM